MAKIFQGPALIEDNVKILDKEFVLQSRLATSLETKSGDVIKVTTRFFDSSSPEAPLMTYVNLFVKTTEEEKELGKRLSAYIRRHKNDYEAMKYHEEIVNLLLADPEF